MWEMDSTEIKNHIFYYKTGKFEEFVHDINDTCEDFCKRLCRQWNFPPLVQLLFGLRIHGKDLWLAGSRPLVADQYYEFRVRIKVCTASDLTISSDLFILNLFKDSKNIRLESVG